MNEINVVEAKSNVVSLKPVVERPLQTPFQEFLMDLHAPVERLFQKVLGPVDRFLEKLDAGTSVFQSFNSKK